MDKKERAKKVLLNYFELLFKKSEINYDSDVICEIRDIVEDIIDSAVDEARSAFEEEFEILCRRHGIINK